MFASIKYGGDGSPPETLRIWQCRSCGFRCKTSETIIAEDVEYVKFDKKRV